MSLPSALMTLRPFLRRVIWTSRKLKWFKLADGQRPRPAPRLSTGSPT
jgi:hypothetical protein